MSRPEFIMLVAEKKKDIARLQSVAMTREDQVKQPVMNAWNINRNGTAQTMNLIEKGKSLNNVDVFFVVGSDLLIVLLLFILLYRILHVKLAFCFSDVRMKDWTFKKANVIPGPFLTIFLCICLRFQEKTNFKTFCRMLKMKMPQYWMSS